MFGIFPWKGKFLIFLEITTAIEWVLPTLTKKSRFSMPLALAIVVYTTDKLLAACEGNGEADFGGSPR